MDGMWDVVMSVEQFCSAHVEPMSEESDHIHIVAITDALQIPVRVIYLDSSQGLGTTVGGSAADAAAYSQHDFIPQAVQDKAGLRPVAPKVHVLYRPGHYDIVYLKGERPGV